VAVVEEGNSGVKWLAVKSATGYDSRQWFNEEQPMTVPELIKLLQQWQGNLAIVSPRIEFGDGSIYENPPNASQVSPRPAVAVPRGKIAGEEDSATAGLIQKLEQE